VVWMMEFLHGHHTGEDEGLWPPVRERDPAAGAEVVVHAVPPVRRFILLHGFARAYRRRAQARWQP
jgi:hypothetical protein